MGVPKISDLVKNQQIKSAEKAVVKTTLSEDDEFNNMKQEAVTNNTDVMWILSVLIMIAPAISMAVALISLDIDPVVARIMWTMMVGQLITNLLVVVVMVWQIRSVIRRTITNAFLHFSKKKSIDEVKRLKEQLKSYKKVDEPEELQDLTPIPTDIQKKPTNTP